MKTNQVTLHRESGLSFTERERLDALESELPRLQEKNTSGVSNLASFFGLHARVEDDSVHLSLDDEPLGMVTIRNSLFRF